MKVVICLTTFLLGTLAFHNRKEPELRANVEKRDDAVGRGRPLTEEDFKNADKLVKEEPDPNVQTSFHDKQDEGFFEGDIMGIFQLKDTAWNGKIPLWSNGTVPYVVSRNFNKTEQDLIDKAVLELRHKTCVRFVPRKSEKDYVKIAKNTGNASTECHPCSSDLGHRGGRQFIVMSEKCFIYNNLLQQMMHTLGFLLEHRRPDRDKFVSIKWENVNPTLSSFAEFDKYKEWNATTYSYAYDYESVMHLPHDAFGKSEGYPTIIPRTKYMVIKQGPSFSDGDLQRINQLYKCKGYPLFQPLPDYN